MILLIHITIAVASIVCTTYLYFNPSRRMLRSGYALIAATLLSGTYLVISTHSPLLPSCTTGLAYLGFVLAGSLLARRRLS